MAMANAPRLVNATDITAPATFGSLERLENNDQTIRAVYEGFFCPAQETGSAVQWRLAERGCQKVF